MGRGGGHVCTILELCFTDLKIACSEQREACLCSSGESLSESNKFGIWWEGGGAGRKHHAIADVTSSMTRNHHFEANDCLIKYL